MGSPVTGGFGGSGVLIEDLLDVLDRAALDAVLALDKAHGLLMRAGRAFAPPPSDRWYAILDQLAVPRKSDRIAGDLVEDGLPVALSERAVRRVFVTASAFLAAEAIDLDAHIESLGENGDAAALGAVADQAAAAAHVLLTQVEHGGRQERLLAVNNLAEPMGALDQASMAIGVSGLAGADPMVRQRLADQALPPYHVLPIVRGRDSLVDDLLALLDEPPGPPQVLVGKAGCGKSTVALNVAIHARERGLQVWWVSAGDPNQLVKGMLAVATQLGASVEELNMIQDDAPPTRGIERLWRRLESCTEHWLLVLDGVDDPGVLAARAGDAVGSCSWVRPSRAGTVLITSKENNQERWGKQAQLLAIEDLRPEAGALVVLDQLGFADPALLDEPARRLSANLGGVPLALRNAGRYLCSDLALHDLPALADELTPLERGDSYIEPVRPGDRIAATWRLSLDALDERGASEARTLLSLLSYYAPQRIVPMDVVAPDRLALCGLRSIARDPERAWRDGLEGLIKVGLIERTSTVGEHVEGVTVHPLVAEVSRAELVNVGAEEVEAGAVELLRLATVGLDPGCPAHWRVLRRLQMHISTLLDLLQSTKTEVLADALDVADRIAKGLIRAGLYVLGEELIHHAQQRADALGPFDPAALTARQTLAWSLGLRGKTADAEVAFKKIIDDCGTQGRAGRAAHDALAWMLAERGQLDEAHQLLTELLPERQRQLGYRHPDTLAIRHRLAWIAGLRGHWDEAERGLRSVLRDRQDVLGANHMDVFGTRYRLGWVLAWRSRLDEAEETFRALQQDVAAVLEPDHAATLMAQSRIAWILRLRGRLAEAEAAYREVLSGRERLLGPDHPRTLQTRHDLALVRANRGALSEAQQTLAQVVTDRERVLGKDHLHSLDARNALALVLTERGRLVEAEHRLRLLATHREHVIGADHPGTLIARHLVGRVLMARGHFRRAEEYLSRLLTDELRVLGAHHRVTLATRDSLAEALGLRGALAEAEDHFRHVLADREDLLGPADPETLVTHAHLGWVLAETGRLDEAGEIYLGLLPVRERLLGADHPDTLGTRYRLAWLHALAGRYEDAERSYRALLVDQQRCIGSEHPQLLRTRGGLARALLDGGRLADAEELYRELLKDRRRLLGSRHPDTLWSRHGLLTVTAAGGRLRGAIDALRELIAEQNLALGPEHRDTLTSRESLGRVLTACGFLDEAAEVWTLLARDRAWALGPAHLDTLRARRLLNDGVDPTSRWP